MVSPFRNTSRKRMKAIASLDNYGYVPEIGKSGEYDLLVSPLPLELECGATFLFHQCKDVT